MAEKYSIVYIYHIFFISSSVHGHLGCFYVLGILSSAAINTGVLVWFQIRVSSGYMPGVGLLDRMIAPFLVFKGTSKLFCILAISIYILTNSARRFPFLHTLSSTCLRVFWWWPSDWCEAIPPCRFVLFFCISLIVMLSIFHVFICLLWRNACLGLLPLFFFFD